MEMFPCWRKLKESDHEVTRTLNLPIRSRTPYPLGHSARHTKGVQTIFCFAFGKELKQFSCKLIERKGIVYGLESGRKFVARLLETTIEYSQEYTLRISAKNLEKI